jgi:tRNA A37 methylthiotransferase MiaB
LKDSVAGDIAKKRHHELTSLIDEKNLAFRLNHASTSLEVLVENEKDGVFMGYDQFYNPLKITSSKELAHSWVSVENVSVEPNGNKGSV